MSVLVAKRAEYQAKTAEAVALRDKIAANSAANTPNEDDQKAFDSLMDSALPALEKDIKRLEQLEEAEKKATVPAGESKTQGGNGGAPAKVEERFIKAPTIGEQIVNSDAYKSAIKSGRIPDGLKVSMELPGTMRGLEQKATFNLSGTGLDTTVNYINQPIVQVEQQRLMIRDLLSIGQTTQNSLVFIKETSFTNAADMVAEEGEKPEATFATSSANAPVKKIAVVAKVTDEMWSDFPMLRDYVNTRLRFMVEAKEEQQLLNGTGVGNQITGILQTSGIQTEAKGGDTNFVAFYKAITKIRAVGFYEPDGMAIHPTDWQTLRTATDGNTQFYGGGPFTNQYGAGPFPQNPALWGLTPVITTAIAQGTALIGAFKLGAQLWQRDGITVDSTNSNEDDFNFNRISLRVEERLALTVYRPLAFCTVTGIS